MSPSHGICRWSQHKTPEFPVQCWIISTLVPHNMIVRKMKSYTGQHFEGDKELHKYKGLWLLCVYALGIKDILFLKRLYDQCLFPSPPVHLRIMWTQRWGWGEKWKRKEVMLLSTGCFDVKSPQYSFAWQWAPGTGVWLSVSWCQLHLGMSFCPQIGHGCDELFLPAKGDPYVH